MEARIDEGGEAQQFYGSVGKRSVEWDLNDWKWDGDLFLATQTTRGRQFFPLGNSSNSSSSCSDEGNDKKRRAVAIQGDTNGALTLNLNGESDGLFPAKKTKSGAVCQVENCEADLSKVKDYHRRHKVCEMHSKATSATVGGILQRFCQQCSRFHLLQEFDEGKRSCRRRLAGHNKRRRKTNPEPGANGNPSDDHSSNYLLITLLKILSNMHNHTGDQDLMSHLLKSLVSHAGEQLGKNLVELLLQGGGSQGSLNIGNSALLGIEQAPQEELKQFSARQDGTATENRSEKQVKMNDFDLNDIYIDSDDTDVERSPPPTNPATSSLDYPSWIHQSSPPQTSRNSDSASDQSPSSSSEDAQMRTGRIVFKLFGKEPNEFPIVLRGQILDWLSHSPTDMESYIRPGCIVLTIYLRQAETAWEELSDDLGFSLGKLLDLSDDPLWTTGWIYVRVQNQLAFVYNGQVVVDTSLSLKSRDYSHIISVKPLAIAATEKAQFTVKGMNLRQRGTRLLCSVEGKYLIQETTHDSTTREDDDFKDNSEIVECVNFSCDMPILSGRGFMEIEDQGLSSSFFPFLVVEDDDVCSEIRILETTLEFTGTDSAKQAMDFIHEIGWLLHRSKLGESDPNPGVFPLIRFQWLIEFSMDREWCAVIRKLLNMFFDGAVGEFSSSSNATLSELCLLHRAVRKNSKPMVEMLLRYIPKQQRNSLFRPDAAGPAGLTPLHIAAGKDGSEDVLDALTEDPAMVGIEAWKTCRDSTGFTPEDYARLRGHFSYIHLIQRKINKKSTTEDHVVVNIPVSFSDREQKEPKSGPTIIMAGVLCFLAALISSAGGIGGGGLFIPIMTIVAGVDLKTASSFSAFMVTGGSIANVISNLFGGKALLDYDLALLLEPCMLLGVSIGVICNRVLPEWLITVLFAVFLAWSSLKTCRSGVKFWKLESEIARESGHGRPERGQGQIEEETKNLKAPLLEAQATKNKSKIPWTKLGVLVIVWASFFVIYLLRGNKDGKGIITIKPCGVEYWILLSLQIPLALIFTKLALSRTESRQEQSPNDQKNQEGTRLDKSTRLKFPAMSFLAGLLGGIFGIGGGMLISPLLLQSGIPPQITAATTSFMVFFSATMSAVQYLLLGMQNTDTAYVFSFICFLASLLGLVLVQKAVAQFGRASIIVFSVGTVMSLSTVLMTSFGALDVWTDYVAGKDMGFKLPC